MMYFQFPKINIEFFLLPSSFLHCICWFVLRVGVCVCFSYIMFARSLGYTLQYGQTVHITLNKLHAADCSIFYLRCHNRIESNRVTPFPLSFSLLVTLYVYIRTSELLLVHFKLFYPYPKAKRNMFFPYRLFSF